jgi:hypothetical protein
MSLANQFTALSLFVSLALTIGLLPAASGQSKTPKFSHDRASVTSRMENVRRLVTTSSGAERIKASGDSKAIALQAEALAAVDAAERSLKQNDVDAASAQLHTATEKMFEAIRLIGGGSDATDKKQRDFDDKAKSVDVLLTAIERIAPEKNGGGRSARATEIRRTAAEAQRHADAGDLTKARRVLDQAYEEAKAELETLRDGDTLVRSLNFASKEEEYHYELDRNDTHKMLLKVLLEDQARSPVAAKQLDDFVTKAAKLRTQAEGEAKSKAFANAVRTLELSTKELQRAIRSAGVYIPG